MRALRIVLFLAFLVGLDRVLGITLDGLYHRTDSGEMGGLINLALKQTADILVLGSSRALHHVSPSVLRERISLSAFNAGADGQDFLYAVMLFDLWSRSHRPPAIVILNVDPLSLTKSDEEIQRTGVFSAYVDQSPTVRRILLMRSDYAKLKYLSYSYRFNGKVLPILKNLVMRPDAISDGYIPIASTDRSNASVGMEGAEIAGLQAWDVKLEYLKEWAQYGRSHGTRFFLIESPVFKSVHARTAWSLRMAQTAASYPGLEFLDLSERRYPEKFADKAELFHDNLHLNAKGAAIFSSLLADEIAERVDSTKATGVERMWHDGGSTVSSIQLHGLSR